MVEYIKPRIVSDEQILAALRSTGAGFEAMGGPSLMLTEAVENGIDSIIESAKLECPVIQGLVEVIIDHDTKRVVVIDNGYGFKDPRHIAEKPFDSLKKYDPELTGQFARGIQGFRQYCHKLTFITKRPIIPKGEEFGSKKGQTIKLEFISDKPDVGCDVVSDDEFTGTTEHTSGAIAIYSEWVKGSFDKIRKDDIIKRLEHHFGEEIRKGRIKIFIYEKSGEKKLELIKEITPKDYSKFQKINIDPIPYIDSSGAKKGEILFELYLTSKSVRNRWTLPFLMYKNRPVGDHRISEMTEFGDSDVWGSNYLTGYIECDFCQINELRLALKTSPDTDFLYNQMHKIEDFLREQIKKHARGIVEIKRQQEISELVNKLQNFIKSKNIFEFKIARASGSLSTDDILEKQVVSSTVGNNEKTKAFGTDDKGFSPKEVIISEVDNISPSKDGNGFSHQNEIGGVGSGKGTQKYGGPDENAGIGDGNDKGYIKDQGGLKKYFNEETGISTGSEPEKSKKKIKYRRPRGFNLSFEDDEFTDALSWFDPATSTILINSAHQRYKRRVKGDDINKEVLDYYAELYMYEICKLAKKEALNDIMNTYLNLKFEFFEKS